MNDTIEPSDLFPLKKTNDILGISSSTLRTYEKFGVQFWKVGKLLFASRSQCEAIIRDNPVKPKRPSKRDQAIDEEYRNITKASKMSSRENLENYQKHLKRFVKDREANLPNNFEPRPCDYSLKTEAELWVVKKIQREVLGAEVKPENKPATPVLTSATSPDQASSGG